MSVSMPQKSRVSYSENRFWSEVGYNRGDLVLRNAPEVFAIESTNYCNIKCIMCPRGEPDLMRRPLGHMDNDLLARIVDQAEFYTEPSWLHWFGEPLMNPQLFDQIEIAKGRVPNLGISTNATLLNEKQQDALLRSQLDTMMIAIDGDSKEVYENVRKSARFSFEEVCANAEGFLARRCALGTKKPFVILSIIVMDMTASDLESFREHWTALGADQVLFKPYTNWGGQNADVFENLEVVGRRSALRSPRKHACKLMWQSLVVTWDGRVVPCCFDYDAKLVLGDLKTQTLPEIWNGPAYVELRRTELEGRNNSVPCASCSQAPGHMRDGHWAEKSSTNMREGFGRAVSDPALPARLELAARAIDQAELEAVHQTETYEDRPLRWTNGNAKITVPLAPGVAPSIVKVKLRNLIVSKSNVRIFVNEKRIYDEPIPVEGLDQEFPIPPSSGAAVVRIESDTLQRQGDERTLGVAIESIELRS
jgi:radical SAM protein with 4Fe4S-binding SPASM domain